MMNRAKAATMKPIAKSFVGSALAESLTTVWADKEGGLATSANRLLEAVDAPDELTVEVGSVESRSQAMRAAAEAILSGNLERHYLAEYTPVENAERAVRYVGMDADEWADVRSGWVEAFHERAPQTKGEDDAYLVERHLQSQFGVDRDTFEELVVGWDDEATQAAMREILLGPLDDVQAAIDQATETINEENES